MDVLVYPCLVQGPGAALEISNAIGEVNRLFPETDTIIVGRGGGSMEELWAFNEEIVARSIFASKIPVISAVGHETDFTISDFVADRRAETPTAAAQMAVPDIQALKEYVENEKDNLIHIMERLIKYMELRVAANNIDALRMSMSQRLMLQTMKTETLYKELVSQVGGRLNEWSAKAERLKTGLEALSPKNIMDRGYAAILDSSGKLTGTVGGFEAGDDLTAVMKDGEIQCRVSEVRRDETWQIKRKK